jgi:outer membrane protein assembly factor BamB
MASGTKSSPVIGNNSIYIGSEDGTLYCISLAGKPVWTFKSKFTIEGLHLLHGNSVYFGNYEGRCLP